MLDKENQAHEDICEGSGWGPCIEHIYIKYLVCTVTFLDPWNISTSKKDKNPWAPISSGESDTHSTHKDFMSTECEM